jgi:CRISPR-associated endoribonuclease Cas6
MKISMEKKQTNFISPFDPIFSDKIEKNFYNKYQAYFKKEPTERVIIRPKKVTQKDKVVTKFKDIIINAWNGTYEIQAPLPYLKFLYDTGIGAKNSQGFGMFEIF